MITTFIVMMPLSRLFGFSECCESVITRASVITLVDNVFLSAHTVNLEPAHKQRIKSTGIVSPVLAKSYIGQFIMQQRKTHNSIT